jgi:hypothetical protein
MRSLVTMMMDVRAVRMLSSTTLDLSNKNVQKKRLSQHEKELLQKD